MIRSEDFNCSIRRYADNTSPPKPHEVRAQLHGGVPKSEIDALAGVWVIYPDLGERCLQTNDRRVLAVIMDDDSGVAASHQAFHNALGNW